MITSLIDLLRDCLPIHAAWSAAVVDSKPKKSPLPDKLKKYLKLYAPGTPIVRAPPPVPTVSTWGTKKEIAWNVAKLPFNFIPNVGWSLTQSILSARLWGWKMQPPNLVTEVSCRARESGYRLHKVLDGVTFGLNGEPKVKVTVKGTNQVLELPLDAAHLYTQIEVLGGKVSNNASTMWPLEAFFDRGFVLVFIYSPAPDAAGHIALPLAPFTPQGPGKYKIVRQEEVDALKPISRDAPDPEGWLEAMTAEFVDAHGEGHQVEARTTETKTSTLLLPRIVVAVSLGTFRERADFEPGGLVGMAKIFPHIMVLSSVELATMEATVKIARTPATTVLDAGDGKVQGTCCGAGQEIGAMMVTDGNEVGTFLWQPTQKPFWGGTFAYVQTDADKHLEGKLHVVKRTLLHDRTGDNKFKLGKRLLVTREPHLSMAYLKSLVGFGNLEITGVEKAPRQGEFDNIHLAPTLKLDLAKAVVPVYAGEGMYVPPLEYTASAATCHTDKVWMAPFCSHDCFHTHWRWGSKESTKWTMGWDDENPHMVPGSPMVPQHQDVWMELHSASSYSYHVTSTYRPKFGAGKWDIVMHHGAAYAQAISDFVTFAKSQINLSLSQGAFLEDSKGQPLTIGHPPLMYWLFRYQVDLVGGKVVATDRLVYTPGELIAARQF